MDAFPNRHRRTLQRDGAPTLVYDDRGSGDSALMFLSGWCVSRKVFAPLPELCANTRRVLSLDWRGHGESDASGEDFGSEALLQDALDVIRAAGVKQVIPVALSHSGWVAFELRRRLGPAVAKIVLLDWIVSDPPEMFIGAVQALQQPAQWQVARDGLFAMWTHGVGLPKLERFIADDMGGYDAAMWARAGREIESAYRQYQSPIKVLESAGLSQVPVMHLYAQPDDPGYEAMQRDYAKTHPNFHVHKLAARSHFPMFEVPEEMVRIIDEFAG